MVTKPNTEKLNVTEARQNFSQILNDAFNGDRRVLVEKAGIPVAAIVSAVDLRRLEQWDEQREQAVQSLADFRRNLPDSLIPTTEEEMEAEGIRTAREARQYLYETRPDLYGRRRSDGDNE